MAARNQRGASLIIVLALVTFLGIMLPAVLALAATGSRVTAPVLEDRREVYAATSAIDAAAELGRFDRLVGLPGEPCPDQLMDIDDFSVTVECEPQPVPPEGCVEYEDRFVSYVAKVREPGAPEADVVAVVAAEVAYRSTTDAVEIRQWALDPSATSPLTTTTLPCQPTTTEAPPTTVAPTTTTIPLPACPAEPTTTTTTIEPPPSTSTTEPPTTTVPPSTTVPPPPDAVLTWEQPLSTLQRGDNWWRAEGTIVAENLQGEPIVGATVTIRVDYLDGTGTAWISAGPTIDGDTTSTGSITFYSPEYKLDRSPPVSTIRLTVTNVVGPDIETWSADTPAFCLTPPT